MSSERERFFKKVRADIHSCGWLHMHSYDGKFLSLSFLDGAMAIGMWPKPVHGALRYLLCKVQFQKLSLAESGPGLQPGSK